MRKFSKQIAVDELAKKIYLTTTKCSEFLNNKGRRSS